jgi:hypothetical protein
MTLVAGMATRPMATAAIAGRSVATRTMRGLRSLTETQFPSDLTSPTQGGRSEAICGPTAVGSVPTPANGGGLVAGTVSTMAAS